jgi:hypothetical protein
MAPSVAAMTPEQLLGPQVCSPVGEMKVLHEEERGEESDPCPQEVMDCYGHSPLMTHSPSTDRWVRKQTDNTQNTHAHTQTHTHTHTEHTHTQHTHTHTHTQKHPQREARERE